MDGISGKSKYQEISTTISELILTPLACSALVNEIVKCLIYQKSQIPYPYNWLQTVVNKRRKRDNSQELQIKVNLTIENHFRVVSTAYDTLEDIMKSILKELNNALKEIIIIFGTTPVCQKEVYTIRLPSLDYNHFDEFHNEELLRTKYKVLRKIFLTSQWMDSIDVALPCTNTYFFIKKEDSNNENSSFIPCMPINFGDNVKHILINLNYETKTKQMCCKNLEIFVEGNDVKTKKAVPSEVTKTELWFQHKIFLKGYKNRFINQTSACDLW